MNYMTKIPEGLKERFKNYKTDFELTEPFDVVSENFCKKMDSFFNEQHYNLRQQRNYFTKDEDILWREFTVMMPEYKECCKNIFGSSYFIDRNIDYKNSNQTYPSKINISYLNKKNPFWKRIKIFFNKKSCKELYYDMYHYLFYLSPEFKIIINEVKDRRPDFDDSFIYTLCSEFIKYMSIILTNPKKSMGMMAPDVDLVWHVFISHTKFYRDFCMKFGRYIIHTAGTNESLSDDTSNYIDMLRIYRKNFGVPSIKVWPVPVKQIKDAGYTWIDDGSPMAYYDEDEVSNNNSLYSFMNGFLLGNMTNDTYYDDTSNVNPQIYNFSQNNNENDSMKETSSNAISSNSEYDSSCSSPSSYTPSSCGSSTSSSCSSTTSSCSSSSCSSTTTSCSSSSCSSSSCSSSSSSCGSSCGSF